MALDYSTLSDEELNALANNDYSKLSDNTLAALAAGPEPKVNTYIGPATAISAVRPVAETYSERAPVLQHLKDAYNVAKNVLTKVGPEGKAEILAHPIATAKAFIQGMPGYQYIQNPMKIPPAALGTVGEAAGGILTAPENLITLPYGMSAYEQQKIKSDPNNPNYQYNPFAQAYRGEFTTQGKAAASNRREAIANMPYGNVTPEEQRMLDEDRMMRSAIRKKAFEKVMGPVAPTNLQ